MKVRVSQRVASTTGGEFRCSFEACSQTFRNCFAKCILNAMSRAPPTRDVWWEEAPGMVVRVTSSNLYSPAELTAIIEQMVAVDTSGLRSFGGGSLSTK
jgi:hypothetical protein